MEIRELDKKKTGENIKRLMRKNGVSTFDLQVALNLTSASTIYLWTQGKYTPNADGFVKLAQVFNCSIDEILILEEEE